MITIQCPIRRDPRVQEWFPALEDLAYGTKNHLEKGWTHQEVDDPMHGNEIDHVPHDVDACPRNTVNPVPVTQDSKSQTEIAQNILEGVLLDQIHSLLLAPLGILSNR